MHIGALHAQCSCTHAAVHQGQACLFKVPPLLGLLLYLLCAQAKEGKGKGIEKELKIRKTGRKEGRKENFTSLPPAWSSGKVTWLHLAVPGLTMA